MRLAAAGTHPHTHTPYFIIRHTASRPSPLRRLAASAIMISISAQCSSSWSLKYRLTSPAMAVAPTPTQRTWFSSSRHAQRSKPAAECCGVLRTTVGAVISRSRAVKYNECALGRIFQP